MSVDREMSLEEWCNTLPKHHRVNKELASLKLLADRRKADTPYFDELIATTEIDKRAARARQFVGKLPKFIQRRIYK